MLLKLATLDRSSLSPTEVAQACAESARRAVAVQEPASHKLPESQGVCPPEASAAEKTALNEEPA
jgi:hypothetical protein